MPRGTDTRDGLWHEAQTRETDFGTRHGQRVGCTICLPWCPRLPPRPSAHNGHGQQQQQDARAQHETTDKQQHRDFVTSRMPSTLKHRHAQVVKSVTVLYVSDLNPETQTRPSCQVRHGFVCLCSQPCNTDTPKLSSPPRFCMSLISTLKHRHAQVVKSVTVLYVSAVTPEKINIPTLPLSCVSAVKRET